MGYNDSVLVFMSINEMRGRWLNMSYYDSGVDILLSTSQLVELYASLQRVLYNIFCVSGQHRAMFIHVEVCGNFEPPHSHHNRRKRSPVEENARAEERQRTRVVVSPRVSPT